MSNRPVKRKVSLSPVAVAHNVQGTAAPNVGEPSTRPPVVPSSQHASSPIMTESIRRPSLSPASSPSIPSLGTEFSHPPTPQGQRNGSIPWGRDPSDGRVWVYPEKNT